MKSVPLELFPSEFFFLFFGRSSLRAKHKTVFAQMRRLYRRFSFSFPNFLFILLYVA